MLAEVFEANADHFHVTIIVAVVLFVIAAVLNRPTASPSKYVAWAGTVLAVGLGVFALAFLFLL